MNLKQKSGVSILAVVIAIISTTTPVIVFGATGGMPTMTVDDCVSRTGQTEAQCTEMINKFKNMTPEDRAKMKSPQGGQNALGQMLENKSSGVSGERSAPNLSANADNTSGTDAIIERVARIRAEKETQFTRIEDRITKIIEFLKSNDVDTTEINGNPDTFKTKAVTVLGAFDAYIKTLNDSKNSTTETTATSLQDARAQIKTDLDDLINFYTITLRNSLKDAIDKIQ